VKWTSPKAQETLEGRQVPMDRWAFLAAQPWCLRASCDEWPPTLSATTSEVIFTGCCCFKVPDHHGGDHRYLFFKPAPPHATDAAQMELEFAIANPKAPSSETTTGSRIVSDIPTLHGRFDAKGFLISHHAIHKIDYHPGDEAANLPPSFTLCFADVMMQVYHSDSHDCTAEEAAEILHRTVEVMMDRLNTKHDPSGSASQETRSDQHPGSTINNEEAKQLMLRKKASWNAHVEGVRRLAFHLQQQVGEQVQAELSEKTAVLLAKCTVSAAEGELLRSSAMAARCKGEIEFDALLLATLQQVDEGDEQLATQDLQPWEGVPLSHPETSAAQERLKELYEAQLWSDLLPAHYA